MKKQILIPAILIIMACFTTQGREILPVNWDSVKYEATTNPQHIKQLVARFITPKLDTTLTYQERILAFYGQSYLTIDREQLEVRNMQKLAKENKLDECLKSAKSVLEINPLNIDALRMCGVTLLAMSKDSVNWPTVKEEDAEYYFRMTFRIYNTIAMTGDGSAEHPFCVTKVSDEYNFMRRYLELWDYSSQSLSGHCDVFTLTASSKYYDLPKIYFDITRVLEIELLMFQ